MRTLKAKDILDMMQNASEDDCRPLTGKTGWAYLGAISCAFYPQSNTRNWFLEGKGKVNRAEIKTWVNKTLGLVPASKAG